MPATLSRHERLTRAARGQDVDQIPSIGGWMNGARNLAELGGISTDEYLADPRRGMIQANLALDVDAMVSPVVPQRLDQIRTGAVEEHRFAGIEPEALVEAADKLPDTEAGVLALGESVAQTELRYRDHFAWATRDWHGIVPIPNFWELGGPFPLYPQYGYVAFLTACALYPDAVGKIWWSRAVPAREKAKVLARLYKELDLVPLLFCGEDLCNNQGPMVGPEMLRKHYFPLVKMILEPIVEAGVRVVCHCDGDVRPLIGDFIDCGFSGLQGFQYEVGVDCRQFKDIKSAQGEDLIFFTGLSVSRTLPFGTTDDVRREVDYFADLTAGGRGMFLFTSNVTGVEVPPDNIRAAYEHVKTIPFGRASDPALHSWPWAASHPAA